MYSATQIDASNFVEGVDRAFIIILGFQFAFIMTRPDLPDDFLSSVKYRHSKHPRAVQMKGNTKTGNCLDRQVH